MQIRFLVGHCVASELFEHTPKLTISRLTFAALSRSRAFSGRLSNDDGDSNENDKNENSLRL